MKKIIMFLLSVLVCSGAGLSPAMAYDYRNDRITEGESVCNAEDAIIEDLDNIASSQIQLYNTATNEGVQRNVEFENAVHVYNFTLVDFIDALNGDFAETLKQHEWTVWEVPVSGAKIGSEYATIGEDGFTTSWSEEPLESMIFLHDRDFIDALLADQRFDSVYITAIPVWSISFVTVVDGSQIRLAPFATRDDLMNVDNGTWYTAEEMTSILSDFNNGMASIPENAGGGRGSGVDYNVLFSVIAIVSGILIVALVIIQIERKLLGKKQ